MASFFSADYWKALYFKAIGGQETAADPNAMSGSFAGSSEFTGSLASESVAEETHSHGGVDPYYYKKRKKKLPEPVSKGFDKDWKPPTPRPVPVNPPVVPEDILARQLRALDTAQAALKRAAIEAERRAREAEEEDEEDVALLLLS